MACTNCYCNPMQVRSRYSSIQQNQSWASMRLLRRLVFAELSLSQLQHAELEVCSCRVRVESQTRSRTSGCRARTFECWKCNLTEYALSCGPVSQSPEMNREEVATSGSCRVLNRRRQEQGWKEGGTAAVVTPSHSKVLMSLQRHIRKVFSGSTRARETPLDGTHRCSAQVCRCVMLNVYFILFTQSPQ